MEHVRHRRFPRRSFARHGLQHGADATSPARTDSVLLRAVALHGAHHTVGATEEIVSPSAVAGHSVQISATTQVSGFIVPVYDRYEVCKRLVRMLLRAAAGFDERMRIINRAVLYSLRACGYHLVPGIVSLLTPME